MILTNTTESGLESLIVNWLVTHNGYEQGHSHDYNVEYAVDTVRLFRFLRDTQPEAVKMLQLETNPQKTAQFLARVRDEITKRGIVDVLRRGVKAYPASVVLFYMTPSANNPAAATLHAKNIFSVTRQLHFSPDATHLSLDLCIFINGLPVITFELKNQLTKQNVDNAVYQYQHDRNPRELLFQFTRCMVHFAVDDAQVKFCTRLQGKESWFLPFNKGYNDGAGNPPNPDGLMTDYLWKHILTKEMLSRIIENYAAVIEEKDRDTGKTKYKQIFPRYHQLTAVESLLGDVRQHGVGKRYLIQHSAGSGKSNSIAWLAHQLTSLEDAQGNLLVDSVLVVTDRVILDKQIRDNIRQFAQVGNIVAWAEHSGDLRKAIEDGRRIIITTIEKFPYVLPAIGTDHKDRHFAIIIDEAHSSQNGKTSGTMNMTLSAIMADPDLDNEDKINAMCEGKKLLTNASYFAFTATPKNKTLETFGTVITDAQGNPLLNEKGERQYRPFHVYTMKQAIQEGFILDVLKYYTPISSYYRLRKTVEDDPMFDKKKAQKKLRAFVENQSFTIAQKADIMVTHFHEQVIAKGKIGGQARAMVITSSIERCIEYYRAINRCLTERHSPYKAIIAFSGEKQLEKDGPWLTSAGLNGFPDAAIPKTFKHDPYRFLIVADMFQTGYDEPLLHTMYVDKQLYDIKAVQTLSRLNRSCPKKYDTFVLDFFNDPNDIIKSFSRYYKTTLLSGETDPNKLYDLMANMELYQVFSHDLVDQTVNRYLDGADRDQLDPVLDACATIYKQLDPDGQIKFKSAAKGFVRTYGFLSAILPYGNPEWEKLSIFLNMLLPKLPSPREDDLSIGILDAIDLDSYRVENRETISLILSDENAEVGPVPTSTAKGRQEPEMDLLSTILSNFNDIFGNIDWKEADNMRRQILEIPAMVSCDEQYQNAMRNSDKQEARTESDRVLQKVIYSIMADNMELFKLYTDNQDFRKRLSDLVFNVTYNRDGKPYTRTIPQ